MTHRHDIPIIDAHQHFWDLERFHYPWLQPGVPSIVGDTSAIRHSYGPDQYRHDAGPYNIAGSVHLDGGFDPTDPVGETRFADAIAERHGLPSAIVGHVPLHSPDAETLIRAHVAASPRFRGVRHIVAWHKTPRLTYADRPDLVTDPDWVRGYGLLARFGLSADMQIYPSQMADTAELAARHPDVPMLINQAGMPDGLIDGDLGPWRQGIRLLAAQPNVAIKLSGFGMLVPAWTAATISPIVEAAIEAFGTDRVMFASNFPVDRLFKPLEAVFDAYFDCVGGLDAAEQTKLFASNAARLYRLPERVAAARKV